MLKAIAQFINRLAILLIAALMLFSLFFATLQTKWVKQQIGGWICDAARKQGIEVSIGSIDGRLPFKWTVNDVRIQFDPADSLSFKSAKARIAFFPLLRGEISVHYLSLRDPVLVYSPKQKEFCFPDSCSLPFNFSVKMLKIANLRLESPGKDEVSILSFRGKGKARKDLSFFSFEFKAVPYASQTSSFFLAAQGNKSKNTFEASSKLRVDSCKLFEPMFTLPFESEFIVQGSLKGRWNTFASLFSKKPEQVPSKPLQGTLKGIVNKFEISALPFLNRKWNIETSFCLSEDRSIEMKKIYLENDLIAIEGNGKLDPGFELTNGFAAFHLPQISLVAGNFPVPLKGSVTGEALYNGVLTEIQFLTENLEIGKQSYPSCQGTLVAALEETSWQGQIDLNAEHKMFPFGLHTRFLYRPRDSVVIRELLVTGPEAQLNGDLEVHFTPRLFKGSLFAQALHLNIFEPLLPESRLSGRLGAEIHFSSEKGEKQGADIHLSLNHFRYLQMEAAEAALEAEILDLFGEPRGKCSLDAAGASFDKLELSSLSFRTSSEKEHWPFDIKLKGTWEGHLEVDATGTWAKKPGSFALSFHDLDGFMLRKPFSLEKPFSIQWSDEKLLVTDFEMDIADGNLQLNMDLSKKGSNAKIKAEHLPIDILTLAYPNLSLNGTASVDAFIDATPQNIQGRCNLLLESADVYQFGKSFPLKAKGFLQANLDNKILQIHSGLHAIDDQILDFSATLPIDYRLYPFKLKVDEQKPLASELIVEGKLEEIFDFVNLGSHRAEGQLSCRLFLSRTLASPSLNGKIELENGFYENYYTGTLLKDIYAAANAENDKIALTEFTAKDDQGGSVAAHGSLDLDRSKKFPYAIQAEVSNLNFLRFDMITTNFNGPVEVSGNTESALASGTLTVSKAEINMPDEMPIDVPVLSVTYVNQPENIEVPSAEAPVIFPFHYDLNLSAGEKVFVRGRGLNSEWGGDMHLTGTNAAFNLDGTLTLLRGEYAFSGKVFSLTEGQITFVDRAAQSAHLNLKGTLALPQLTVTAILNGPLNSPKLTFQSMPQMPTSSILAHILFNKDVSDINPIQAIQLAQVLVSISGGMGPDVLEKIRRSLGVDRINIVTSKSGLDDTEALSIQIGKYLTRGVMVTLSQSADSTNIIVEVELKHGFVLQAETQEEQQGKFSFKWNRNY